MTVTAKDPANAIAALSRMLRRALEDTPEADAAKPLLDAVESGRLFFEREPWYDVAASLTNKIYSVSGELLLRARDENGVEINRQPALHAIAQHRLYPFFDRLVTLAALDQTIKQDGFPVSINISARNATDESSLLNLHKTLQHYFAGQYRPEQVIFEFLEDDAANGVNHDALTQMRGFGYLFAIDDQSHSAEDAQRLQNLGPYADYVKIDGKTLEAARDGHVDLGNFVERICTAAPQARILCEWVDSAEDAEGLNGKHPLISLVQGRNLGHDAAEFSRRVREKNTLNGNKPPCC